MNSNYGNNYNKNPYGGQSFGGKNLDPEQVQKLMNNKFFQKMVAFASKVNSKTYTLMKGRNGMDALNFFLMMLFCVLILVDAFVQTYWLSGIGGLVLIFMLYRIFSKKLQLQAKMNGPFKKVEEKLKLEAKYKKLKKRDRYTHIYKKCPKCKHVLRAKRMPEKRVIPCPNCGADVTFKAVKEKQPKVKKEKQPKEK